MVNRTIGTAGVVCLWLAFALSAEAVINPVGLFTGDLSDDFNRFTTNQAVQVLDVFDEHGTISNLTDGGAIKIETSSTLGGDLVRRRSGWMMGQLGIGRWDFDQPAWRFGGYFENNSGADDATLFFYDENLSLIGSVIADIPVDGGTWVWNGWESDTPFSRIEVVGNGLINGFIWYEDMQLSLVPEPATLSLFVVALILGCAGRRGRV